MIGRSATHNDRLEKLERSNTVHGLRCGEGVSLTLVVPRRETTETPFR
jgi:hypothetical protein